MDFTLQVLTLTAVILTTNAVPKCITYGKTDVVCTATKEDYVLERGLVSDNDKTTGITLRGCRITDVDLESFTDLPKLKYIDLSKNKIRALKLGVLDEPKQVTYLNISYNQLTSFPLGLFDQMTNIDVLDLKGNKINYIELGVFDNLKKLRHVDLSSNALVGKNLNPFIFDQSPLIKFIDFSRNDMSETSEEMLNAFTETEFLNLDRCLLNTVPSFATRSNLNTMKHLMLSTNKISSIVDPITFVNLDDLEILNLAENSIENLNENVFQPLKNIKYIILRRNKLTTISELLFKNLPKLNNLVLSHNSLEHIPVNSFRGTGLKTLNLASNRFSYLQDNFCLELRNSGVVLNKFFFNQNPWQCACLKDILKEVKVFKIEYNGVKYKGKEPVCVTTQEFNCKRLESDNKVYVDMYDNAILTYLFHTFLN